MNPGLVKYRWNQGVEEQGGGGKVTLSGSLVAKQVATPGEPASGVSRY